MLTKEQLLKIMPSLADRKTRLDTHFEPLVKAMGEAHIDTPKRIAAFLAQVGHESGEFRFMGEVWGPTTAQLRYEPVTSLSQKLGNTQKGDGFKYRGRGPIQLTGRANYRACGKALGLDLENNPDLAGTPEVAHRVACWFWLSKGLNEIADGLALNPSEDCASDPQGWADGGVFDHITMKINGGYNGREDRNTRYARACQVLGA